MLLVRAKADGYAPPVELSDWIANMKPQMSARLILWGLLRRRRVEGDLPILFVPVEGEDPLAETDENGRPLTLLEDWRQSLLADNCTPRHADDHAGYVRRLFVSMNIDSVKQLSDDELAEDVKRELRRRRDKLGLSESGSNHYLQAVKQFCGWLRKPKRILPVNPLVDLSSVKQQTQRPHERRPMTKDEFGRMLNVLMPMDQAPGRGHAWSGRERALLYWLAVSTSFRADALRHLRRCDFNFEADRPYVSVPAQHSKNRKYHEMLIPRDLAEHLRGHLQHKAPGAPAFNMPRPNAVLEHFRKDLAAAKVDEKTPEGLLDFHALRHTAITWLLVLYRLPPREVMDLVGVSSLALLERYSRGLRVRSTDYVDKAPRFELSDGKATAETA
jgi:integrase